MICSNCGKETDNNSKFCPFCGKAMNDENGSTETVKKGELNNNKAANEKENELKEKNRKILGIFSLVLAVIAFLTGLFFFISIPLAIISIVLAFLTKPKNGYSKSALIISIIVIIFNILFTGFFVFVAKKGLDAEQQNIQHMEEMEASELYFYGEACKIPYTNPWTEKSLSNGDAALIYGSENAFLTQIGFSLLSDTGKPFITDEDKRVFYDDLYAFWESKSIEQTEFIIIGGSDGLLNLNDHIYMATFDYGLSKDTPAGKYIMLVDPEKNAALSFRTYAEESVAEHDQRCIELLRNIEIDQQEKIVVDDDMYEMMDNMSAWNMYSNLREGEVAKEAILEGEWRILDEYSSFYVFKDGNYVTYKTKEDIEDNYIKGKYIVDYGKNGLLIAGLDENAVQDIVESSNGVVSEEDICVVTCMLQEFVNDGVPQELDSNQSVMQVWIIVDHNDEGIEAQVYNVNNNSMYYYVKTKDSSFLDANNLLQ